MELISRQAGRMTAEEAIATLKANYPDACFEQLREAVDMAIAALEKADANHPEIPDSWIPVTEKTPEEKDAGILKKLGTNKKSDYVIATVDVKGERMTVTACTYDGAWDWNMKYAFPDYKIIAWMPMPEPYKKG